MTKYHHGNLREALLKRAASVIKAGGVEAVSLRSLARDLGVSSTAPAKHFRSRIDLLRTLAMEGYRDATKAVLNNADGDEFIHPNTMAKSFLNWALENPSSFSTIMHPDVIRHADDDLKSALSEFAAAVKMSLAKAQETGWQETQDLDVLFNYAIAFVRGLALNSSDALFIDVAGAMPEAQSHQIIDLVFPHHS